MLKRISKFFRQFAAFLTVMASDEMGGVLFDYANGKWEQIHVWKDKETREQLDNLGSNLITHMRDNIYVAVVKCRGRYGMCGTFQIIYPVPEQIKGMLCETHMNKPKLWENFFCDLYPFPEAYEDAAKKCIQIAEKLGYRMPETI